MQTINTPMDWHDTDAVNDMCKKLVHYHNPAGLLKLKEDFVDEAPLTEYELRTMCNKAFENRHWRRI